MGREILIPQGAELDKYTGQILLQKWGFPVPRIFDGWKDAQQFINSGGSVLGRGRFVGATDNLLVDCLPTESCTTKQEWADLVIRGRNFVNNPGFISYCNQMGVDPTQLRIKYFLQEESPGDVRIITLDNDVEDSVFVQVRKGNERSVGNGAAIGVIIKNVDPEEGEISFFEGDSLMFSAYTFHRQVREKMRMNGYDFAFQMEMTAALDLQKSKRPFSPMAKLSHIVQVKVAGETGQEGLVSFNGLHYHHVKDFLQHTDAEYVIVESDGYLKHFPDPISNKPYILLLDEWSETNLPIGYNWGNIKMLIIDDNQIKTTFLQHKTYRLIKLVWQRGGMVVLNYPEIEKQELYGLINTSKNVRWEGRQYPHD